MRRLLIVLAAASCGDSTTNMVQTIQDMSMAMLADLSVKGDLAVPPGADLAQLPDLKPPTGDLAMMAGSIPDPGTTHMVDGNFGDVEPNDSPGQATPLGVSQQAMMYFWVTQNNGGGTDTTEYYVFKTGNMAGTFSLGFSGICWSGGITGIDATLWKVVAGAQVLPPVQTWPSNTSCTPPATSPAVEANTVYLLGLDIRGTAGMYFA